MCLFSSKFSSFCTLVIWGICWLTAVSSCFIENSNGLFLKGYLNLSACEDPDELHKLLVPSCYVSCSEHSTDRAAAGRDPSAGEISDLHFRYLLLPELSVCAGLLFSNWLNLPPFWVALCTLGEQNKMWLLLHLHYSLNCIWNLGVIEHWKLHRRYDSLLAAFSFRRKGKAKQVSVLSYQSTL